MLEDKTANNIITRYHRIITGDQNQIKAGGDFSTCKITSLSVKDSSDNAYYSFCAGACVYYDDEEPIACALIMLHDDESDTFDLILYGGKGTLYIGTGANTVTVEGNAEVEQIVGNFWYSYAVNYTGDFSLSIVVSTEE